jgi:hypothetical protein
MSYVKVDCSHLNPVAKRLITYVNFKVLYIRRGGWCYFHMFGCCLCDLCSIQNGIGRYELIQMVDIELQVFQ